ncbi:MAG TPA: ribonuclease III [Syntrophales bacterium]|nr:ribonuclease III [Syntrophales bacterium]
MHEQRDRLLRELEEKLRYTFRDITLLDQALTHRSFVHENRNPNWENNERMEFLGDAVLDFCISDMLVKSHKHFTEGQLSKLRASLVNERSLSVVAGMIGLGDYVRLGKGEESSGGKAKVSILSDTLEAVVAAIYLDGGFQGLTEWFQTFFMPLLERNPDRFHHADYKTALQQVSQKKFRDIPTYTLTGESGPDHHKLFEVRLTTGTIISQGTGRTKKEAEQEAARKALARIKDGQGEGPEE